MIAALVVVGLLAMSLPAAGQGTDFDTSGLPRPPTTFEEQRLWDEIETAHKYPDLAPQAHEKLAAYYERNGLTTLAARERAAARSSSSTTPIGPPAGSLAPQLGERPTVRGTPPQPSGRSEALQPGTYRCSSYNVSGGGGSCRNFQPLILSPDGTYQHSSTRGRWRVQGGKLLLSESALWGPGEVLGQDTVRFVYDYRDRRHVVT